MKSCGWVLGGDGVSMCIGMEEVRLGRCRMGIGGAVARGRQYGKGKDVPI